MGVNDGSRGEFGKDSVHSFVLEDWLVLSLDVLKELVQLLMRDLRIFCYTLVVLSFVPFNEFFS